MQFDMFSIHHIALSVSDLERSINFYSKFGFENFFEWKAEDLSLQISHLRLNGIILELFCYKNCGRKKPIKLAEDLRINGVKHFALKVKSIEDAIDMLVEKGLADHGEIEIKHGRTGIQFFFIQDPDNNFLEIVQDDRFF